MSLFDRFRLDGKRMLVTGGSRGLGREMALAIAEAGADVILVARNEQTLAATADDIRRLGRSADTITCDVGQPDACQQMCERALAEHGPIDILINNVGGRRVNVPTEEMPLELWHELMDLNLTATFLCTRLIGGSMVRGGRGGRVINVASMSGMIANRNIGGRSYEASKAAVIHFTKAVATDWAPHGITVNAICPGFFMTDVNVGWSKQHPEMMEMYRQQVPMGTFGEPEDLGPLAVYLASDAARYMTGSAIVIDGGYTAW